jgi:hypothetical protein
MLILKRGLLAMCLGLAAQAGAASGPVMEPGARPPEKLSDLYKFLTLNLRKGLDEDMLVWPIRLVGRASEIIGNGLFYEVEMTLKPFDMQGLHFEKGEVYIKRMSVDKEAMKAWDLKVLDYREVQTRLIFTLRSLESKLASLWGGALKLSADSAERLVEIMGRGKLLGFNVACEVKSALRWDERVRKLYLVPKSVSYAGYQFPKWLWWLGRHPIPEAAILDLGATWVPLNIQEIYVGWDRINLSTSW